VSAALAPNLRVALVEPCVLRRAARQARHLSSRHHVSTLLYGKMRGMASRDVIWRDGSSGIWA